MVPFCDSRLLGTSFGMLAEMTSRRIADETALAAGLPPDLAETDPVFVPYARCAEWAERAARRLGERNLGAVLGARHSYRALGPYAHYVLEAPTLLHALGRARRALPLIANVSRVAAWRDGDHLVVGYRTGIEGAVGARHVEESLPPLIADLARGFHGADWRASWIALSGGSALCIPSLADRYGGVEVRPGRAPGIAIPMADLRAPNPAPPSAWTALTLRDLPSLAHGRAPKRVEDIVRQMIRLGLRTGDASCEAVAARLDLGVRTLQRRLASEALSFRELRLQEVLGRGRALLVEGDASIEDIARALGYDEPRRFRRAFRARFGCSPSQARAEALAGRA